MHRSLVAVLALLVLASACSTTGSKAATGTMLVTGALAVGLGASQTGGNRTDADDAALGGAGMLAGLALIAGVTALVLEARHRSSTPKREPISPIARPAPAPALAASIVARAVPCDPELLDLMIVARLDAARGRCEHVRELGLRVRTLDARFHRDLFLSDPTIATCY